MGPHLLPHIQSWWYVSDRVAAIDFTIPGTGMRSTRCRVVNAYGPTMQKASKNPQLRETFYSDLQKSGQQHSISFSAAYMWGFQFKVRHKIN